MSLLASWLTSEVDGMGMKASFLSSISPEIDKGWGSKWLTLYWNWFLGEAASSWEGM